MSASTMTTFGSALKTRYTEEKVQNLTEADNVLLGLVKKNTGFSGDAMKIPIIHENPQGISAGSRATSQSNATNLKVGHFSLVVGDLYGTVEVGDKVLTASRDNPGAFLQNKVAEIDGMHASMGERIDIAMHGNGGFAIGRVSSIDTPTNVITLATATDAVHFHPGMVLQASTADGTSGSLKTGEVTVSSVNWGAGTITINNWQAIDTPTGVVANDYLFEDGTFGATSGLALVKGLGAFIYSTSTAVPDLLSLVRSTNPDLLAGIRLPSAQYTGANTEERLLRLGVHMTGTIGVKGPDTCLLNPQDWMNLTLILQGRGIRPLQDSNTKFGYAMVEFFAGDKLVKAYPDRHQPKGVAMMLAIDTWTLWSMKNLIHYLDGDGTNILRKATTDDYEIRAKSYPGFVTNAPGRNGRTPV